MKPRRGRTLSAALAVALLTGVAGGGTAAGEENAERADAAEGNPTSVDTVTLLTGDQVQVSSFIGGKQGISVKPAPGREGIAFTSEAHGAELRVVPSDATLLLQRGDIDPRLFDVKKLLRDGLSDRKRSTLPLILGYKNGAAGATARSTFARRTGTKGSLRSVNADVISASKAEPASVWATATRQNGRSRALAPGISRIWLDGAVQAALDKSVAQIGAPTAWGDGLTGRGVLTAVLDTGIDAKHPDLDDAVAEAKDFTDNANGAVDGNGHGTHVASIITGSGRASGGKYAGVAPDTRLLVGKVLNDQGGGTESQIIAGMEWATARGARIVSMSLGAEPTDGTDAMSQAVNTLTASSDALFVISAGNRGATHTVESPAAADAALAVGAVDAQDGIAAFSSQGPRVADAAIKPEITAPGVGIVAARASGTSRGTPVDDAYTALDGTSMATPHVAGAAALLAQQHPEWNADRLKAVLTSTAKPTPGTGVFAQGAGRVDLVRAARQQVSAAQGSVSSYLRWPHTAPTTRTVAYENRGSEPVTLDLAAALEGQNTPALVTVQPSHMTIPAHGTGEARLTIDAAAAQPGTYGGVLTASSADERVVVRTALSFMVEDEVYDTTMRLIDRAGRDLALGGARLLNLETGERFSPRLKNGQLVARVPKGRYSVEAMIYTDSDEGVQDITLESRPDVRIEGNTSLSFDARAGEAVTATVKEAKTSPEARWLGVYQTVAGVVDEFDGFAVRPQVGMYAVPSAPVTDRPYKFRHIAILDRPATPTAPRSGYNLALTHEGRIPEKLAFDVDTADLAAVRVRYHSQGDATKGLRSNLFQLDGSPRFLGGGYEIDLPAERIEYFTSGTWSSFVDTGTSWETDAPSRYAAGKTRVQEWNKAAIGPWAEAFRCEGSLVFGSGAFSPSAEGHVANAFDYTGSVSLRRDGVEVAESGDTSLAFFDGLPPEEARYTLNLQARPDMSATDLASRVEAEWGFASAQSRNDCEQPEPLPLLNVRIGADFDLENSALAGRPLPLTIGVERAGEPARDVRAMTVELSRDEGISWQRLDTRARGEKFTAVVPPSTKGTGYISLRVKVADHGGNTLKQTVIRAFRQR
ncbi:S8 family serine peptidase [Streptomyces sp. NPDC087908]|uniref:S8 family serine peptidase n=1 Tax=Streptomyces sp. NPDC087908 TaxID=3365820 RepID=UPI00380E6B96